MVERGPRLRGRLTLDTQPFRKSLQGARSQSGGAFRSMEASSKRLSGSLKALGGIVAGLFAARAIGNFFRAGEGLESIRNSIIGVLGPGADVRAVFQGIDEVAAATGQSTTTLSSAFVELQKIGIASSRTLTAVADASVALNSSTVDVSRALVTLRAQTLQNLFGFDQVTTGAAGFKAVLDGVTVAQGESAAAFRESLLTFIETSKFAGAAAKTTADAGAASTIFDNAVSSLSASLRTIFGPALVEVSQFLAELALSFGDVSAGAEDALSVKVAQTVRDFIDRIVGLKKAVVLQIQFIKDAFQDLSESIGGRLLLGAVKLVTAPIRFLGKTLKTASDEAADFTKNLGDTARAATETTGAAEKMDNALKDLKTTTQSSGDTATQAGTKFKTFAEILEETESNFNGVAFAARNAEEAIGGAATAGERGSGGISAAAGRSVSNLGGGVDESDPGAIRRRLAGLREQQRQVGFGAGAASRIQQRAVSAEIARLEAGLVEAERQRTSDTVDAILRGLSEFSGEALTQRLNEELAIRRRQGLLPATGSTKPGFVSTTGVRF